MSFALDRVHTTLITCAGRSQAPVEEREKREKRKIHFCICYEAEAKMQKRFIVPCFASRFPTRKSRLAKLSYVHTEKAFNERRKHPAAAAAARRINRTLINRSITFCI